MLRLHLMTTRVFLWAAILGGGICCGMACGGDQGNTGDVVPGDGGKAASGGSGGQAGTAANRDAGGGGSGGSSGGQGGQAGLGGNGGGAGASGGGGAGGAAGAGICGACLGIACSAGVQLGVYAEAEAGTGIISSLTVDAPGLNLTCSHSGCQYFCTSGYMIADGDYTVTLTSPGYDTVTLTFTAVSPTNCGCCGCCPYSFNKTVVLHPNGQPITGCCADTQNDPNNCGQCGHACRSGALCKAGQCAPSFSACLDQSSGLSTCASYCASVGRSCAAGCGTLGTASVGQWFNQPACDVGVSHSEGATCQDALPFAAVGGDAITYRCCCTD